MATRNHLGKSLFYATALPATNDSAGFEALSWVELEYCQTHPQFGTDHANIDVTGLKTGRTDGVKGSASGIESEGSCRIEGSTLTDNQLAFRALCNASGGNISLKAGTGSGTAAALAVGDPVVYAQGYVKGFKQTQATSDAFEGFTYMFKQNESEIIATEPA